jgi:hypothetical protein
MQNILYHEYENKFYIFRSDRSGRTRDPAGACTEVGFLRQ